MLELLQVWYATKPQPAGDLQRLVLDRLELMRVYWLHQGDIAPPTNSGESDVGESGWHRVAVQPHQEVLDVLALRFRYGSGIGRCHGKAGDVSLALLEMGHWIEERTLTVSVLDQQGVVLV